ncbi:MAG: xylulokinase [Christensenellales bacterium]
MARHLIGIDIGTTGTKSMLVREDGQIIAHAYAGYPLNAPAPGLSEQDAEAWWQAVVQTVKEVVSSTGLSDRVVALSLSTQGGTLVPVDDDGTPLHPAIVWNDKRCATQRAEFAATFGEERMYHTTGWQLQMGLNALQIAWLRNEKPEIFNRAAFFLSVADYISYKLTGVRAVDMSNAGINQLADIKKGEYDPDILAFAGIDASRLAELTASGQPIAQLSQQAAKALGLPDGVLLVAGAHDQYAACLGAGMTGPGNAMIGSGTAWVVTALSDQPDFSKGFAQSRAALKGVWGSLVSLSTGGVCLDWLLKAVIGPEARTSKPDYDSLNQNVSQRKPGTEGLMFFPYFGAASYPVPQARWRAGFLGLDLSHDRYDMARAVMEGVACHIAWVLEHFQTDDQAVVLSGGAGKSAPWRQLLADILGRPLRIPAQPDLPCIGAAIMAGLGGGVFPSAQEAIARLTPNELIVKPDQENSQIYKAHQAQFRERALALAELY